VAEARQSFELVEQPPAALGRPLAMVDGRAYAAAWPYVRPTTGEDASAAEVAEYGKFAKRSGGTA